MVLEYAYAKVNLNLYVLGKKNGYHELETVMAPVGLYDTLEFEKSDSLMVEDIDIIDNSVLKTAKLMVDKYHLPGVAIKVTKRIPTEAGLGGASADSSAVLRGINRLYNLGLSFTELEEIANEIGSDNVFCLYNKVALCKGRGNKLEFIDKAFSYHILLIKPNYGLSTKAVFDNVNKYTDVTESLDLIKHIDDIEYLNNKITNDLYEPATLVNEKLTSFKWFIEALGFKTSMSGSGSTFFVLSNDFEDLKTLSMHFSGCFAEITTIKNCF